MQVRHIARRKEEAIENGNFHLLFLRKYNKILDVAFTV
jgi:hypothetical protein